MKEFDIFWKTNQGSDVFKIVYKNITDEKKLEVLYKSIEQKIITLSCSKTESFIVEKLIKECPVEIKNKI